MGGCRETLQIYVKKKYKLQTSQTWLELAASVLLKSKFFCGTLSNVQGVHFKLGKSRHQL